MVKIRRFVRSVRLVALGLTLASTFPVSAETTISDVVFPSGRLNRAVAAQASDGRWQAISQSVEIGLESIAGTTGPNLDSYRLVVDLRAVAATVPKGCGKRLSIPWKDLRESFSPQEGIAPEHWAPPGSGGLFQEVSWRQPGCLVRARFAYPRGVGGAVQPSELPAGLSNYELQRVDLRLDGESRSAAYNFLVRYEEVAVEEAQAEHVISQFSFADRLLINAISEHARRVVRLCEVLPYAELASWAYLIRPLTIPGVRVTIPDRWQLVPGYEWSDQRTGLKAGLFKHPKSRELVLFFAGTDKDDWSRTWEGLRRQFDLKLREVYAICSRSPSLALDCLKWKSIFDALEAEPVWRVVQLAATKVPVGEILDDPVVRDLFFAFVSALFGAAPDIAADANIAMPKMDERTRAVFDQALTLFATWNRDDKLGRIKETGRNGIAFVGGHSLGGALAQVVALKNAVPAVTFNSAPFPLDPDYRNEIGFDKYRLNIIHVRSPDDPLTRTVDLAETDASVKEWATSVLEAAYISRGNELGARLKKRYEEIIQRNDFYAGSANRLLVDIGTGHSIDPMVDELKGACSVPR